LADLLADPGEGLAGSMSSLAGVDDLALPHFVEDTSAPKHLP
jgi:hypothetical protein